MLLPRELDLVAAGRHTPLPRTRPPSADLASTEPPSETAAADAKANPSPAKPNQ